MKKALICGSRLLEEKSKHSKVFWFCVIYKVRDKALKEGFVLQKLLENRVFKFLRRKSRTKRPHVGWELVFYFAPDIVLS